MTMEERPVGIGRYLRLLVQFSPWARV